MNRGGKVVGRIPAERFREIFGDEILVCYSAKEGARFPLTLRAKIGAITANKRESQDLILDNAVMNDHANRVEEPAQPAPAVKPEKPTESASEPRKKRGFIETFFSDDEE